jgi:LacI family transcriptional regulator
LHGQGSKTADEPREVNNVAIREPKPTINDVGAPCRRVEKDRQPCDQQLPLLNDATRDKVTAVIRDLGYVPNPQARALALRRNFLIGLIHDNPNAQMVLSVQEGMLDAMKGTEFALVVRPVDRKSPRLFEDIRHFIEQQRLYGIYVLPQFRENDESPDSAPNWGAVMSAWGRRGWTMKNIWSNRTIVRPCARRLIN